MCSLGTRLEFQKHSELLILLKILWAVIMPIYNIVSLYSLNSNRLSDDGASAIAEALKVNETLTELR